MKDNRLDHRDVDKIRRRLDLLLKDCARYMKREQPDHSLKGCQRCIVIHPPDNGAPPLCTEALRHEARLLTILRGFGIYDTGVRPPTIPKELRQLRGRIRISPAPKIITYPLPQKRT